MKALRLWWRALTRRRDFERMEHAFDPSPSIHVIKLDRYHDDGPERTISGHHWRRHRGDEDRVSGDRNAVMRFVLAHHPHRDELVAAPEAHRVHWVEEHRVPLGLETAGVELVDGCAARVLKTQSVQ